MPEKVIPLSTGIKQVRNMDCFKPLLVSLKIAGMHFTKGSKWNNIGLAMYSTLICLGVTCSMLKMIPITLKSGALSFENPEFIGDISFLCFSSLICINALIFYLSSWLGKLEEIIRSIETHAKTSSAIRRKSFSRFVKIVILSQWSIALINYIMLSVLIYTTPSDRMRNAVSPAREKKSIGGYVVLAFNFYLGAQWLLPVVFIIIIVKALGVLFAEHAHDLKCALQSMAVRASDISQSRLAYIQLCTTVDQADKMLSALNGVNFSINVAVTLTQLYNLIYNELSLSEGQQSWMASCVVWMVTSVAYIKIPTLCGILLNKKVK